jgi:hypothetical protein
MLPISPSSIAIPTSVETNDLATENEVSSVCRSEAPKYRS